MAKLYVGFFLMHLKSQMQYKTAFFLTTLGNFLTSFTTLLGVWFIFDRFQVVEGFTFNEILLCFAIMTMSFSLAELFARGFDTFPRILGNGEFDRVLVRPRNTIFLVLAAKTEFTRLGRLLQSLLVFVYVLPRCGVVWSPLKILTLVLMVSCGCLLFFGLFLVYASFAFFTVEGLEFMNILTDGGREFGRYPFAIYGEEVLKFLTYIVPLALVQYYPLLYLLDQSQRVVDMLAPVIALVFLLPCYQFFRFALRRYRSTGS
ncbi:MAG: ABC-2 family transporter protein [Symbiobacteriaceae bacterium]|nr:ABC-2 family transporter protein [Symbiobacteriaceae bacterium]